MEYLHSLLKFAVNMGASDVHVKPDHPIMIRISGELFPVQIDPPTREQVEEIVRHMLPKHLEARLEREKEADFSYIDPALGRFRVNVFFQRGQVTIRDALRENTCALFQGAESARTTGQDRHLLSAASFWSAAAPAAANPARWLR